MSVAELLTEGEEKRNGIGALRTVQTGIFRVWERINAFERPIHMQYQIEKAKPIKMEHYKGIIDLKDLGNGTTQVTWVSEGQLVMPLIGRLLDHKMQKQGTIAFNSMPKSLESR